MSNRLNASYTFQENNILKIFLSQLIISWLQAMLGSGLKEIRLIIPSSSLVPPHVISFIAMALFLNLGPDHTSS